jgi:TRAP-type C4-dicarboxylate transport system substrate-binding protein
MPIASGTIRAREFLIKSGMQINDVAPEEINRMREKVKPVISKYASQVGEALVKQFDEELAKARTAVR